MEVWFCSATFFFDPLLALDDAAMRRRAYWGVFSLAPRSTEMTKRSSRQTGDYAGDFHLVSQSLSR
jgi:hypothetical protein